MAPHFTSPSAGCGGSNCPASSQTRVIVCLLDDSHPNGCVQGSHGFGLHFPGGSPSLSGPHPPPLLRQNLEVLQGSLQLDILSSFKYFL